jgi:Tfp pilus assembly protein PilV
MAGTAEPKGFILIESLVAITLFAATVACLIQILNHSIRSESLARDEFSAGLMLENTLWILDSGADKIVDKDQPSWRIETSAGVPSPGNLLRIEVRALHDEQEIGHLAAYRALP